MMEQEAIAGVSLEQSRLFLETLVASAPVGLAFVDLDLRFIHVNETLAEINGVPRRAHLGRKVRDVIPELWPAVEPQYQRVIDKGTPALNLEISGPTPKAANVERHFLVSYYPVRDAYGRLQGVGVIVVEETERKQADQQLRRTTLALEASEERYRTFVAQSSEGIWRMEVRPPLSVHLTALEQAESLLHRACVAEANDMLAKMHGFNTAGALTGQPLSLLFTRTRKDRLKTLEDFVRGGYRLDNIESRGASPRGREPVFLTHLVGVVEEERLVRVWGTQRDVTEQVHAREDLRASREELRIQEHQLRTITDALPALVGYIDLNERYVFCNRAYETWFGTKPEQVLGRSVREVVGETSYANLRDWIRRALAGETVRFESTLQLRNGRTIHVQPTYVPSRNSAGQIQGFVSLTHDITERMRTEAEVETQRARLYDILMNAPASMAILKGERQVFELVNPVFKRIANGTELLGRSLLEFFSDQPDEYSEALRQAYESGKTLSIKEARFRRDSRDTGMVEERFYDLTLQPLRDANGQVDSVMSFAIDVTDQVEARKKLEEGSAQLASQQRWLESVYDLSPIAMLLLEPGTGRVVFANQAAHRMAGGRLQGTPIADEVIPGLRAARGARKQRSELEWNTPTGRYSLLVDFEMLSAAHGHPATVVVVLQDVSQLKQTEARLHDAVRLRDDFLTVASHELKTPLTPLQLRLQALMRDARESLPVEQLRERVLRATEGASAQVRKLTSLINDLLDVTQLTGTRLTLSLESVDLAAIARDVARQFKVQAAQAGCTVFVEAPVAVVGRWDRHRLEQVTRSLLSNAIKYGNGRPVRLRVEPRPGQGRLTVRDEGIGIPSGSLSAIFEKFGRAVSTRNYGGLGLGLYLTRQLVEAHQGTLHAESEPGQGATFIVDLPLSGPR